MAQGSTKSSQRSSPARKRRTTSSGNGAAPKTRSRASSNRSGSSRSGSSRSGSSRSGSNRSGSNRSAAATRSKAQSKGPIASARDAVTSGVGDVTSTVSDGAQSAGQAIGTVAGKAKVPAAAGGAALAGLVGGVAIATRGGGKRKLLGMPVPGTRRPLVKLKVKTPRRKAGPKDLVKAGSQMAELATEMRLAREQLNSGGRRRSPVEVVLEGLTARRGRGS
jgi:hypothetical protein